MSPLTETRAIKSYPLRLHARSIDIGAFGEKPIPVTGMRRLRGTIPVGLGTSITLLMGQLMSCPLYAYGPPSPPHVLAVKRYVAFGPGTAEISPGHVNPPPRETLYEKRRKEREL